jgi:hypothetical protein
MPLPGLCRVLTCQPPFIGVWTAVTRHSMGTLFGTLEE